MALLLRQELKEAVAQAHAKVLHGHPSLEVALRQVRVGQRRQPLSERAKLLLAEYLRQERARFARPESTAYEVERAVAAVAHLPWEDTGGLSRADVLALLERVDSAVDATPTRGYGPLFPGLL